MSEKEELLMMDFYEILNIAIEATDKEIKKSYRKAALKCHPDKNPDNPKAAAEFNRLQKIFDILSDPVEKLRYDKVLKGRKLAAIRARERSSHSRKLKDDLDRREREAALVKNKLSDSEKLAREIERLKEEGDRIMREENEKMERELKERKKRAASRLEEENSVPKVQKIPSGTYRVKVKWLAEGDHNYDKEQIHNLFYKWGELNAVVIKLKGQKGTAIVDYKDKSGADMAVQFERGLESCPLTVTALEVKDVPDTEPAPHNSAPQSNGESKRDFESLADMNKRRKNERARLMQEMLRNDGVED